jgi:hypothetical protein
LKAAIFRANFACQRWVGSRLIPASDLIILGPAEVAEVLFGLCGSGREF